MDVEDRPLRDALDKALGHAAPFGEEELRGLRELSVQGAADLSTLAACTRLRRLELLACGAEQLDFVLGMQELTQAPRTHLVSDEIERPERECPLGRACVLPRVLGQSRTWAEVRPRLSARASRSSARDTGGLREREFGRDGRQAQGTVSGRGLAGGRAPAEARLVAP